jgi:flagellar hook-associated protein 1 FlgK
VGLDGGQLAGSLSVLAPAAGGSGGVIAEAAASYDRLATQLATDVNAVHSGGLTAAGAPAGNFFTIDATRPAALGISSIQDPALLGAAAAGFGAKDGHNADALAQIGTRTTSPDATWQSIVTGIGLQSRNAQQHETMTAAVATSAETSRASSASVSLDEENVSLLTNQHAYQAAARVMTAVDEALDVLINRTGLVGR